MRDQIRHEVAAIQPADALEAATIRKTLTWIDSGAELCRRQKPATPPKHLVAYSVLVDGDHLLLADHINAELWLPTGGHVESGEHPRNAAIRELEEELGIRPEPLQDGPLFLTSTLTVGQTAGHTDVSLWYVFRGNRSDELTFDDSEFNGIRWFHRNHLPFPRTDPHMARFIEKLG